MEEIIYSCSYKRDITNLLILLINKGTDVNYQALTLSLYNDIIPI